MNLTKPEEFLTNNKKNGRKEKLFYVMKEYRVLTDDAAEIRRRELKPHMES